MAGRACFTGAVALWLVLGGLAPAHGAGPGAEEKEPRSQKVEIVKPDETGTAGEAAADDERAELQRAIEEERRNIELLQMKLQSLKERVASERPEAAKGSQEGAGLKPSGRVEETGVDSEPPADDPQVVREYIWVPKHREGDKVVEGGYQLKVR